MKKSFFICLCFLMGMVVLPVKSQNDKNDKRALLKKERWTRAGQAILDAKRLLKQAIEEKNELLILKYLLKYERGMYEVFRGDSLPTAIRLTDQLVRATDDPVIRAMLQSLEAQNLHFYYCDKVRHNEQETLGIDTPDMAKLEMWNSSAYVQKIIDLLQKSLSSSEILKKTPVDVYYGVLMEGADSKILRPTIYDLLAYEAIDIYKKLLFFKSCPLIEKEPPLRKINIPVSEFIADTFTAEQYQVRRQILSVYRDLLLFRASDPLSPAYLMADLGRLAFLQEYVSGFNCVNVLRSMLETYENITPYSVEIATQLLENYNGNSPEEKISLFCMID